jgi:hypothetical protein
MTQIVFDFKDLITHCLHDEEVEFTNAINLGIDIKTFISELFQNLKSVCQETKLEELFQQEHFHLIRDTRIKEKIENLVDNPYFDYNKLCQIPLSQEFRLYGNLKKVKYTSLYLFRALIIDPNHLIYHHEKKFKKLKNLVCLFSKTDCPETKRLKKKEINSLTLKN